LLTPTIFLVLVLVFIGAAQEFELPLLLTGGGPRFATSLVNLTIYRIAFQYGEMGYASSVATITFFFLLGITAFQFALQKKWVNYME
jgi:multiple sugar transport system permease protein